MHPLTPNKPSKHTLELAMRLMQLTILHASTQDEWLDTAAHEHILVRLSVPPSMRELLSDTNRIHWRLADEHPDLQPALTPAEAETAVFSDLIYWGIHHLMSCEGGGKTIQTDLEKVKDALRKLLAEHEKEPQNERKE